MSLQHNLRTCIQRISASNARSYAAAANVLTADDEPFLPREPVKQSTANGINVSTVETNGPVSRLAVYIKAGSRYEREDRPGIVHTLRVASGLSTKRATQFGLARTLEQNGANITCTVGREAIAYTLEASRDKIQGLTALLNEVSVGQAFKPWEVEDLPPLIKQDLGRRTPEVRTLEALHKVAFRRGLGNGLYTPKYRVGNVSAAELQDYQSKNFGEVVVSAVGLSIEEAVTFGNTISASPKARQVCPSKFNSGEYRKLKNDNLAYVAIAIEGASLSDPKKAIASQLAQRVLGAAVRTKRGNPAGKLTSLNDDNNAVTAINVNYSDSGILGAFIGANPEAAGELTRKVAALLRDMKVYDAEVAIAKGGLKGDIGLRWDSGATLVDLLGLQSLLTGKVSTLAEVSALIDSVSAADVNAVLASGGGKLALATYGNISKVPYLDEL